jgi:Cu(I)/Ag(I) efflux system periplasmic protein CusF
MKRAPALLFAFAMWAAPHGAVAQSLIDGEITKVDTSAGKITIKHGPIRKLGMNEGMTMVFKAQDPAMLKAVKAGDHVKFDAADVNGQLTLTKVQKTR